MGIKLIMRRNGQFRCDWEHADGKCGADTELCPMYYYECEIIAAPILDRNDFLVDQLDINRYFQTQYTCDFGSNKHKPRSCERIALDAAANIAAILNKHFQHCHNMSVDQIVTRIRVSVGFDSQVAMIAEWTPV